MKTSNKILLGGLIVLLLFITFFLISLRKHYREEVSERKARTEKQQRELKSFSHIQADGNLQIRWSQNRGESVFVEADKTTIEQINTTVEDEKLIISANETGSSSAPVVIYIEKDTLGQIFLEGESRLKTEGDISQDNFELIMNDKTSATLRGKAENAVISCSGESRLYAEKLNIDTCHILSSDSSYANINVTRALTIEASGESRVHYSGNPETVNIDTSEKATTRSQ